MEAAYPEERVHRGHAFAGYIADAEEQFVVAQEEVIEVATDTFGRCQHAVNLYLVTMRKSRERLRQHGHLNMVCDIQFALNSSFRGGGFLQFLHIALQRLLHGVERVAQLSDFIMVPECRQRRVEITLGHLLSGLRKEAFFIYN